MLDIAFTITSIAIGLLGIVLWVLNLRRVAAGDELIKPRNQRGIPFGFLDVILLYFFMAVGNLVPAWLVCQSLGIEISEIGNLQGDSQAMLSIANAAGFAIGIALALGVYRLRYGEIRLFGDIRLELSSDVVLGLVAGVMVIPLLLLFQSVVTRYMPYKHNTLEMLADKPTFWVIAATWLSAVIVAPICEEIIFRGVLQSWLQRIGRGVYDCLLIGGWDSAVLKKNGGILLESDGGVNPSEPWSRRSDSYWPMVISSLLFGLAHIGQGPAPITLFFFGMILGYLYRKTGSITSCIVLHMMLNGFTMFWFTLQLFFGDAPVAGTLE
jgi:membrane protease YdiL (CAAX protease family)